MRGLTPEPEAGAHCGSSARWDLCGGRPERAVPTATARSALKRRGLELGHNKIRTLFNRVTGRAVDQRLRWLEHHRQQGFVGDGRSPVAGKRVLVAVDGGRVRMRVGARGGRRRANGHRGYKTFWKEASGTWVVSGTSPYDGPSDSDHRSLFGPRTS